MEQSGYRRREKVHLFHVEQSAVCLCDRWAKLFHVEQFAHHEPDALLPGSDAMASSQNRTLFSAD